MMIRTMQNVPIFGPAAAIFFLAWTFPKQSHKNLKKYYIEFDIIMHRARHTAYCSISLCILVHMQSDISFGNRKAKKVERKGNFSPFLMNSILHCSLLFANLLPYIYFKLIIILYYFMELFCVASCMWSTVDSSFTHTVPAHARTAMENMSHTLSRTYMDMWVR